MELQADRGRTGGGGLWRGYGQLVALGWPMALLWRRSILLRGWRRWMGWLARLRAAGRLPRLNRGRHNCFPTSVAGRARPKP